MKVARILCLTAIAAIAAGAHLVAQDQTPLASNFLYNYYTKPGASLVQAGMYPAPHYVPQNVGHTYYTYQPLMPHEHMYEHSRNYYNYYAPPETFYRDDCGAYPGGYGLNKTTVVWQAGCTHYGPSPHNWAISQKLHSKLASMHYCLGNGAGCGHLGCGPHGCRLHGHHGLRHHHLGAGCADGNCTSGDCANGNCQ